MSTNPNRVIASRICWNDLLTIALLFLFVDGLVYVTLGPVSEKIVVEVRKDPSDITNFNIVRNTLEQPIKFGVLAKVLLFATTVGIWSYARLKATDAENAAEEKKGSRY